MSEIVEQSSEWNPQNSTDSQESDTILCVLFKNGKMAASYYKISEGRLYISNEMVCIQPGYMATKALIREVQPRHVVTLGSLCDHFIKSLIDMLNNQDSHTTLDSDQLRTVPNKMSILSLAEYTPVSCEYRVKTMKLASEPEGMGEAERELYVQSLLDFQSKMAVYSLGMLIKFIEKSWAHLNTGDNDKLCFLHVQQISLKDHVLMDRTTFSALQVFQKIKHDANFKHGGTSSHREGISLFRLFAQHCSSKSGFLKMREIMLTPIKNIDELNKRLDFIQFVQDSKNQIFVETLQQNMKHIGDIDMILKKIHYSKGTSRDWENLHRTIYHILFLNEICTPYVNEAPFFADLSKSVTDILYGLETCIDNALDFSKGQKSKRFVIKEGLDAFLDESKMTRENINKHVMATAKLVLDQLPSYLDECTVFYIPDMGYVVAVEKWAKNCDHNELLNYGFQFMFNLNGKLHYKNALCQELDRQLGDIQSKILNHENRIIERVSGFVFRFNNYIREPVQVIALLDCLISMAKVAIERGYVRPQLNVSGIHEIRDGRHPILEIEGNTYVSNEFFSGGPHPNVKITTGPNGSGKSVFLKQITLIVYLAHIGSYLPVSSANVSMVHSIHSRMHATETAFFHLSAFMIDLLQMSQALENANLSSLVLMDEFGRGTTGREGEALLLGALRKFLSQGEFCPHVLVSTHFDLKPELLDSPQVLYQNMQYTRNDDAKDVVFLYKVVEGVSNSYALEIASAEGKLHKDVISRAQDSLNATHEVLPLKKNVPEGYDVEENTIDGVFLKNVAIPELEQAIFGLNVNSD